MQTGMGQSIGLATPKKSAAKFDEHIAVYDSTSNFYYHPFWRSDSLFILEYRLDAGGDTTHQRRQHVKYIIGSGQHTNSHLYEENGYVYQAPITFYTQKGIWELAPGFEGGFSSRFSRIIGMECMSCHNALPAFIEGSENKYRHIPHGIDCERCHGPGQVHVNEKLAGIVVDTATQTDYTIVNPGNLPKELQMNVCQRCHMQGIAILNEGKNFDDFKPGMKLSEVMEVFLPEYDGNETQFIMASHAHRLKKSACYQKSDMTCISCHNPHVSVKKEPRKKFNAACIKCHNVGGSATSPSCLLPERERLTANENDCSGCHMPTSGSIDIPHVSIHDHFIRKPIPSDEQNKIENFIGLASAVSEKTSPLTKAKAYLHYFESYVSKPQMLDSAEYYLNASAITNPFKLLDVRVHLHYLRQQPEKTLELTKKIVPANTTDAWTAYRIAEAHLQSQQTEKAIVWLQRSLQLQPLNPDFKSKLGQALLQTDKTEEARRVFKEILAENAFHVSALTNLGFAELTLGSPEQAEIYYRKALALNPDYEQALLNMAGLALMQNNKSDARKWVRRILQSDPTNKKAKNILQQIRGL